MKLLSPRFLILPLCLLLAQAGLSTEIAARSAKVGQWTQDWDAALALAKTKDLPVLVNFTGSDWCGWCKIMDRDVFAKEDWSKFAAQQLILVHLDFPRDATLVPAEYQPRNQQLQDRFGVKGYPTFIVLDSDGQTELGRLSAGKGKTPASFASEVRQVLRQRASEVAKVVKALGPKDGPAFQAAQDKRRAAEKALQDWLATEPERTEENSAIFAKHGAAITAAEAELSRLTLLYAGKVMPPAALKDYQGLRDSLAKAESDLRAWLDTRPQGTPENQEKFQAMQQDIGQWQEKLGILESKYGI